MCYANTETRSEPTATFCYECDKEISPSESIVFNGVCEDCDATAQEAIGALMYARAYNDCYDWPEPEFYGPDEDASDIPF